MHTPSHAAQRALQVHRRCRLICNLQHRGDSELLVSSHEDFSESHGLRKQERRKDEGDGVLRIKGGT